MSQLMNIFLSFFANMGMQVIPAKFYSSGFEHLNTQTISMFYFITDYDTLPGQSPEALTAENGCFQPSNVASGPPIHLC